MTSSDEMITALIKAGMDVARLNFSHGDHDFHRTLVNRVRAASTRLGKPVAILQDLQGPKMRTRDMEGDAIVLEDGARTTITTEEILGTAERFATGYAHLPKDVKAGSQILLDDGRVTLEVESVAGTEVHCRVVHGGKLGNRKGINLPGSRTSVDSPTPKDMQDVHFGADVGVDAVALSFVRSPNDVRRLRRELANTKTRPLVIAKIEKPQGVENLEGILDEADGVMVARGDLGVEMAPEKIPITQKQIVKAANKRGKIVIVATQMLESMMERNRPTRAEASDVANAVLDGADLVMLSGETAAGQFPRETVEMMDRIVREAEVSQLARYGITHTSLSTHAAQSYQNALSLSAVRACEELEARSLVVYTTSGRTARLVSDYRPAAPIIAFVHEPAMQRRLAFAWGVRAEIIPQQRDMEGLLKQIDTVLMEKKMVAAAETIVLLTKVPLTHHQRTNTVHVHMVGSLGTIPPRAD
jgi:pyruvate kinase